MVEQGLALSEALQRFSDPSDWQELLALEPYAVVLSFAEGPETEDERQRRRYQKLEDRLEAAFLDKLLDGSLVASGFLWPVSLQASRRIIPAARWRLLRPDFSASEASGGGLRLVDVRVQEAQCARTNSGPLTPAHEPPSRTHASRSNLRSKLRRWLEQQAAARGTDWQKKHYFAEACAQFGDRVTSNLFKEVWRHSRLPDALRRPGLRKLGSRRTGASPSV